MRRLLVMVWLALVSPLGALAGADTIAMLPLDGEKRLEIYGQPVAAEIARALKAAGLDVVVVGARMDVPDRAQLIVDGTIKSTKNKQIELTIRIRDPRDGTTLDTLPAPPTKLDDLDKAAAELSARVVPSVQATLEKLAKAAVVEKPITNGTAEPVKPRVTPPRPTLTTEVKPSKNFPRLRAALDREAALWAATQRYEAKIWFDVIGYRPELGKPPMARARVRVVIEAGTQRFDRVVRTDTIVGDRESTYDQLAERTAREVLAIVRPNLRRTLER